MTFDELYSILLENIKKHPKDIRTIPLKGGGVWFYCSLKGNEICIQTSQTKEPSSRIKADTKITKMDLKKIYPLYLKRQNGEKVSQEALRISRVQVYCYAIFNHYGI